MIPLTILLSDDPIFENKHVLKSMLAKTYKIYYLKNLKTWQKITKIRKS